MAELTEDQMRQQEEEEFEFRARAEAEEAARKQAAASENKPAEGAVSPEGPGMLANVVGAAQIPFQVIAEHPVETGLGFGAYKAYKLANKYVQGQQTAANAANAVAQTNATTSAAESASRQFTNMNSNYTKMGSEIRQYVQNKIPVPQELLDAHARLGEQLKTVQSQMPGYNSNITGTTPPKGTMTTGPVTPQAMPQAPAADMYGRVEPTINGSVAPEAARGSAPAGQVAQAAEKPGMLKNLAQMAGKYGSAFAESPLGKTLGGVARIAGSAPVMGAQLALHSGGLNVGEDQQMAQIRRVQDTIGKMAPAQQSMYFTLPADKRQQVNQMIMNGQDPSGLLVPNAVNSGFTQQLNRLGR
jgi:hypothetical protein